MKHEKIFTRPDGTKIKVVASYYSDWRTQKWDYEVEYCLPKKRTWISPVDTNDYTWRKLSMPEREIENKKKYCELASVGEIMETQIELHKLIAPPQI